MTDFMAGNIDTGNYDAQASVLLSAAVSYAIFNNPADNK